MWVLLLRRTKMLLPLMNQLEDDIIRLLSTVEQAMVNTNEAFVVLFSAGVLQVHIGLTNPAVIVLSIACSIGLR
jgi:hypothetical protein